MKVYLEENLETCYNKSENERLPLDLTRLIWSSRCDSFSASAESCKYFWELFIMSSAVLMSRASCLEETCLPKSENLQRKNQGTTMTWGYIFGMVFHHNLKKVMTRWKKSSRWNSWPSVRVRPVRQARKRRVSCIWVPGQSLALSEVSSQRSSWMLFDPALISDLVLPSEALLRSISDKNGVQLFWVG